MAREESVYLEWGQGKLMLMMVVAKNCVHFKNQQIQQTSKSNNTIKIKKYKHTENKNKRRRHY